MKSETINISEDIGYYTIKKGDTLTAIARELKIPLAGLISMNPRVNPRCMQIGQRLSVPKVIEKKFSDTLVPFREIQQDQERLNILPFEQMINGYYLRQDSDDTYAIEDKKAHKFKVFRKGKLLFECITNSGQSGNDYLTKTFTDKKGNLMESRGNMSTPAGIFTISGVGKYKGSPAFTRANKNGDIPSSIHEGAIVASGKMNRSNGCTRIAPKDLEKLSQYLMSGTKVYILPEGENSKFFIRNGEINFSAQDPYGGVDTDGRKGMKDFSVTTPFVSKEIKIDSQRFKREAIIKIAQSHIDGLASDINEEIFTTNYGKFVQTIEQYKIILQKDLGLNNDTYNELAQLACSIALQESKFGESKRYQFKNILGDSGQDFFQKGRKYAKREFGTTSAIVSGFAGIPAMFTETDTESNSKGIAQIKIDGIMLGKNQVVQDLLKKYGIDRNSIADPEKSGIAIMILLGSMYLHEIPQLKSQLQKLGLSNIEALIYLNQGKKREITQGTATPEKNQYFQRIKNGMKEFEILQKERKIQV